MMFEESVIARVKKIRKELPYVGVRKLCRHLLDPEYGDPISIGRDYLFDVLRNHNLLIERKRKIVHTSVSDPKNEVYPNLLPDLEIIGPNQVWVTDITYLSLADGRHCYLFLMMDYYSRKILGWSLEDNMKAENAIATFNKAYNRVKPERGLIHHSDKGSQYTSKDYVKRLTECNVRISMTGINKCYDNALAERVNGVLKYEFDLKEPLKDLTSGRKLIKNAIELYNSKRLHTSLNYRTPDYVYSMAIAA